MAQAREKKETWPIVAHASLHENEEKQACWVLGQLWPLGLVGSWLKIRPSLGLKMHGHGPGPKNKNNYTIGTISKNTKIITNTILKYELIKMDKIKKNNYLTRPN